jgi:hypothetical protein
VKGENAAAGKALEETIVNHCPRAGEAFLGGLEDKIYRTVEATRAGKMLRRSEQHGDMPVVTAAVEHAWCAARVWNAGLFLDGQRIHVSAQTDGPVGIPALEHADETGAADPAMHFDPRFAKQRCDAVGRAVFMKAKLGMRVKLAPEMNEGVEKIVRFVRRREHFYRSSPKRSWIG